MVRERAAAHGIEVTPRRRRRAGHPRLRRAAVQAGAAEPAQQRREVHSRRRARRGGRPTRDGDRVAVTVTDDGVGIRPEDRERIFESFQQGRRGAQSEEGTGLGLTLCRRIVALLGGTMWLETEVGCGQHLRLHRPDRRRGRHRTPRAERGCRPAGRGRRRRRPRVARPDDRLPRRARRAGRPGTRRHGRARADPRARRPPRSCSTSGCPVWTAGRCSTACVPTTPRARFP